MKTKVSITDFLKLVKYKPKHIGGSLLGVRIVEFRGRGRKKAHLEYEEEYDECAEPVESSSQNKGFYIYFEIIDLSGYKDGDVIPLKSDIRSSVVWTYCKTLSDYENAAAQINTALGSLYRRKTIDIPPSI